MAEQAALDGAWAIDLNTKKAILSKSAYALLDYSSEDITVDDRLQILVKDSGKGIPDNKMHRLFSPFDRLDLESENPNIEGTSLGPSLCKRLVEAMNGSISANSK